MLVLFVRTLCVLGGSGGKLNKPPGWRTVWDCISAKHARLARCLEQALPAGHLSTLSKCTGLLRCAQDGGVLLVATTRENVSPSLVLELLRRIGGIIKVRRRAQNRNRIGSHLSAI